jgi:hypothetical protein
VSPIYVPGKVTLAQQQKIPVVIGEPWGGGYFAGYISHTADGNPTHALIVAPRETGATGAGYTLTTSLAWKTANTTTAGTTSVFDGAANTAAMVAAGIADYPAAQFCVNLNIGGFTDWYLPSLYELDIAYFNLKPSTTSNNTASGTNLYAVPPRSINYTSEFPRQTYIAQFAGGSEVFTSITHVSSTEASATAAWRINFSNGQSSAATKTTIQNVRAFRRIAL